MTPPPRPDVLRAALPDATLHAMIETTFGYGWQAKGLNYEKGRDVLVAALSAALAAPTEDEPEVLQEVWVLESGCYSDRSVVDVYATAEDGMAAHPLPADYKYPAQPTGHNLSTPGGWRKDSDGNWDNGLDWDASLSLTRHIVNRPAPPAGTREDR